MNFAIAFALGMGMMQNPSSGTIELHSGPIPCYYNGHQIIEPCPEAGIVIPPKPKDGDTCVIHGDLCVFFEMDVPAVQVEEDVPADCNHCTGGSCTLMYCGEHYTEKQKVWHCKDTSRILLTAENGSKHCVKFGGR